LEPLTFYLLSKIEIACHLISQMTQNSVT